MQVARGEIVGVIGPNGAGKTTLLRVVAGEVQPTTGSLAFDGAPLHPAPHKLTQLGLARTTQGLDLPDDKPVADYVLDGAVSPPRTGFGAALRAIPRRDRADRGLRDHALALLRELGLSKVAAADVGTLPHHLRVRAALAAALISSPRLLLLDELAAGLAPGEVRELGDLLAALVARPGRDIAVLLVEHRIALVEQVCGHVVVLDDGRVVAQGAPAELRADAAIAADYLSTPD